MTPLLKVTPAVNVNSTTISLYEKGLPSFSLSPAIQSVINIKKSDRQKWSGTMTATSTWAKPKNINVNNNASPRPTPIK